MCIILVAIKIVVNTLSYSNIIMLVLLGTIINVVNNYIGVLIDLKNPKLNWISEQTVVKQNFNTMILMGILSLQLIGIVYLGYKLQNLDNFIIIIALIYAILFKLIKSYINRNEVKLYDIATSILSLGVTALPKRSATSSLWSPWGWTPRSFTFRASPPAFRKTCSWK